MDKSKDHKDVTRKKEEKTEKCKHGTSTKEACLKCEEEKAIISKNIASSIGNFQTTLKKMKRDGWQAFYANGTNIIRFKDPTTPGSVYCPITGACKFLKNRSFGGTNFLKAARLLELDLGINQINDAADNGENYLSDENSKSFRNFLIKEFGL